MKQHGHQAILHSTASQPDTVQSSIVHIHKTQSSNAQAMSWRGFSFFYMTCLFFTLLWFPFASVHAQSTIRLRLVQTVNTSDFPRPSPDPSGIVYLSDTGIMLITDGEVDEIPRLFKGDAVFGLRLPDQFAYSRSVFSFSHEPSGVGFNPRNNHIFYTDDEVKRIFEVGPGSDGIHGTSDDTRTNFKTTTFGNDDPEDVAYNTNTGELIIAEGTVGRIYIFNPGPNGRFDGVAADGGDDFVVRSFSTQGLIEEDPEGIAYDPTTNHILLTSRLTKSMAEITLTGGLVRIFDLIEANPKIAAGVTIAPGSRNPTVFNYYIVDRGIDNDIDPNENDGKMFEMSTHGDAILYLSSNTFGSVGGVSYGDEDILAYDQDSNDWNMYFDGSDVGLGGNDVDAFELQNDGTLLMSVGITTTLPDVGFVQRSDVLKFIPTSLGSKTRGRFEMFLDASDVGLGGNASEDVDSIGLTADGHLVVSTRGNFTVPGLNGTDKDLIVLNNAHFGGSTSGSWARYLEGVEVGLDAGQEDVRDIWQSPISKDIFLTVQGNYSVPSVGGVPGVAGDGDDIFVCTAASLGSDSHCTYRLFWNGENFGFGNGTIDGLDMSDRLDFAVSAEVDSLPELPNDTDDVVDDSESYEEPEGEEQAYPLFLPFVRY